MSVCKDIEFSSYGALCRGKLLLPEGDAGAKPPVVMMAHGFGAEMNFRLPAFAERFAARGMAVMMFDYRNFGASDGEPRNLVDPLRHVADWKAAVSRARELPEVDGGRVALWGTSFSGGHVIVVAAGDPEIKCIVAQAPFVHGPSSGVKAGPENMRRMTMAALRDVFRAATFRSPYYLPIVSDPGEPGMMNAPDSKPGYLALVPPDSKWENKAPARVALKVLFYSPIKYARKVKCPALIIPAAGDTLISLNKTLKTAALMEKSELYVFPGGHFDLYAGDGFETIVKKETEFLAKHL